MKVACSDLLLPHLIERLPTASPPNSWQVTLWHDTLHPGRCRRVCVQVAGKAVREVNKRTGSSDWKLWKSKVSANAWVKAEAVSQINYACTPLKTQAAKVPELCWIIYRLVLVFTELWAEFKGMRWRIKVWALWKHHHSQNEHQHHKSLQLCWVQAEASRYFQSRSHQVLSWHRGREFSEGVQPEHAHVQTLQVFEYMPAWPLGKHRKVVCQTACDPSHLLPQPFLTIFLILLCLPYTRFPELLLSQRYTSRRE